MRFTLIHDAGAVITKAWSLRFLALAVAVEILDFSAQNFDVVRAFLPLEESTLKLISIGLTVSAGVARFVAQRGLSLPKD